MSQTAAQTSAAAKLHVADVIIRAGAIYSMAADRRIFRAIAIRDEWIVAVSEDPHGLGLDRAEATGRPGRIPNRSHDVPGR